MNRIHPPSIKPSRVTKTHLRIWGKASGKGRTWEEPKGKLTFRDYTPGTTIARKNDWLEIKVEEIISPQETLKPTPV